MATQFPTLDSLDSSNTSLIREDKSIIDILIELLENPQELIDNKLVEEIEESIEEREEAKHINRLAIRYREGYIELSDKQADLLRVIFRGREKQFKSNKSLGEALVMVLNCKTKEQIDEEMKEWL